MNMRNFIILLGFMIGVTSCSLDTIPTDKYIESNFWQTPEQIEAGLTACYTTMRSTYLYGGNASAILSELLTPNAYCYNNEMGYGTIVNGLLNSANASIVNSKWGACYEGIGRTNTFLEKIKNSEVINEDKKFQMEAEAKFLRAFYYFELINYYGAVPLILESPNILTQSSLPRTPQKDILEQILKDLKEAAAILPAQYAASTDLGRPTSGAAFALCSRVCLYNSMWKEAEEFARLVIQSGKYTLYPDYKEIFSRDNENNSEVIFDIQFLNPDYTHGLDLVMRQYNTIAPLLDLVKAYEMKDGSKYNDSKPLYEGRDPRFYATIAYPGGQYMGVTVTNDRFKFTGYTYKKFTVYDEEYAPEYDWNDINYIIIRYADILLSFAEARNEQLAIPDKEVYDAINLVRNRKTVEMPSLDFGKGYTKDEMRELIRHERRIELAGEGTYYHDIIRWKIAEKVMNGEVYKYDGSFAEKRVFEQKNYLWPIPEVEFKENPNLLPNNPGW